MTRLIYRGDLTELMFATMVQRPGRSPVVSILAAAAPLSDVVGKPGTITGANRATRRAYSTRKPRSETEYGVTYPPPNRLVPSAWRYFKASRNGRFTLARAWFL
jgi:hypothetical protein